jgi:outer membrane immunogenic protein
MRKFAFAAAIAATLSTAPAYASGEGRVEARGGIAFTSGIEEPFLGIAAGYDFDLGEKAFIGLEGSADKVLQGGSPVLFGVSGRLGVKASDKARIYALGGYGFTKDDSDPFIGAGVQFNLGSKAYGKVEYRRVLTSNFPDVNLAGVGFGVRF